MEPSLIIISVLVVFFAFLVKSTTGFANSLIIVPVLSLFLDINLVIGIAAILSLIGGSILFSFTKKQIKKEFILVLVFVLIGTFVGTHFLIKYNSALLEKLMGGTIILFSIPIMFNKTFNKTNKFLGAIAGFFSGIFGGMFTTDGPPLAIYFGNKFNKKSCRATLNIIFLLNALWINILYITRGITNPETVKYSAILLIPLIIGIYAGSKIHLKINEKTFKRILASILIIVGISFIF